MADIEITFENKTPVELLGLGIRAYKIRDYNTAVAYLSKASEVASAEHGPEHESLGDIYLHYGKALLEVTRLEGDVLGDAAPRVEDDEDDDEEDGEETNEADTAENGMEQDTPEDAKTNGVAEEKKEEKGDVTPENGAKGDDEKTENADATENGTSSSNAEAGTSNDGEKTEDTDKPEEPEDPTDLQVAWEVLELARVIFEKGGDKYKPDLADTLITLGEVSLESETFDLAIRDIKQGLEVQKEILDKDSRTLAETNYKLGMAYGMNNQHDEAAECYTRSMEILKAKITNLKDEEEIAELKELLPEIEEKITDMKNLKDEILKKAAESSASGFVSSPEKKASDISHLVKRKRKLEDDGAENTEAAQPSKKSA